jgi:hypothetical protein
MVRENQAYWLRAVGLWFLLMTAETLQGLRHVKVLSLWIGDEFVRDVGVFTGSLIILLITFSCIGWIPAHDARTLLRVGTTWVVLTIGYELALGRFVFDRSWSEIASDFDHFREGCFPSDLSSPVRASPCRVVARPHRSACPASDWPSRVTVVTTAGDDGHGCFSVVLA